jgi:hypothetical protein
MSKSKDLPLGIELAWAGMFPELPHRVAFTITPFGERLMANPVP